MSQTLPYGTWPSPITAELIVGESIGLGWVALDGDDLYWLESRPREGGRTVLVRRRGDGVIGDVTPPPYNVRSRVHEYGGGAALIDGVVYFVNFSDQRIYVHRSDEAPRLLTPEGDWRFAAMELDARRRRLICVCEDHTNADPLPENRLVSVALDDGAVATLARGRDFYAGPRLSSDGRRLAWLSWDLPNMPWDGSTLWVADVADDGSLGDAHIVAGGMAESIAQPEWSPDGVLHFVSDRSGWWNLYRAGRDGPVPLCPREAEFAGPQWGLGMTYYGFLADGRILSTYNEAGTWRLGEVADGTLIPWPVASTDFSMLKVSGDNAAFVGASARSPAAVVALDVAKRTEMTVRASLRTDIDADYLSTPQGLSFPSEGGATAHGLFYPPVNKDARAPTGDKPPLIVRSHGGPTGASSSAFNLGIQFWTSRGFALLDVNYRGSSGYGRAYRDALDGQWGVADVDDCVAGARHLVAQDLVDGERLIIRGSSAGGYTTLAALAFRDVFKAGASHYGIGDLERLAADTHKFESGYLDRLIGPYPQARSLYLKRSPAHHPHGLNCPVIFFQGREDKIVPPNQAEQMVQSLKERAVTVAYVAFDGEGHGFRQAANIKRALEAELYFYGRVFGFTPADAIDPVPIDNPPL